MRPDKSEFLILAGGMDGPTKGGMQFCEVGERARFGGAGGDPGRVLENWAQAKGELLQIEGVELGQL